MNTIQRIASVVTLSIALPVAASAAAIDSGRFSQLLSQARHGDAEAQFRLGLAYLNGEEVEEDADAALAWLGEAAGHGHYQASLIYEQLVDEDFGIGC